MAALTARRDRVFREFESSDTIQDARCLSPPRSPHRFHYRTVTIGSSVLPLFWFVSGSTQKLVVARSSGRGAVATSCPLMDDMVGLSARCALHHAGETVVANLD